MRDQPPSQTPPEDVLEIGAPERFAALSHPLRHRSLLALGHRPATTSRLAARVDALKDSVAHRPKALSAAGLVHVAETRQVHGGTERYYQRTARRTVVAEPRAKGTAAMLAAVAQELDRAPAETHLTLRHLRLSPAKARQLGEALARLVDEAEEDAEGRPVHGVLVAFCRQSLPTGTTGSG
ncbi:ArsR/SmtB family transcription factor [Streptomyces sp. NPDC057950]|uniref:ArsR/SmtB family transcription factor n=1 Tax=Streptomyces sp. NPDC057950 TaxID=3346288 RepID=UPI0036EF9238